ncbi:MAG TPA: glycoside hydrolase family 57 protein [Bacteroidales bacterium]|nr:glycoside hydrolase family 57 protein [Bacteroidales bacterium]
MRNICLYFQIHQPFRFRRYRFFDIGNEHYYYDDYLNESIMQKVADKCYIPANRILLDLIKKYKDRFKVTFSISGIALDQFELYAPEVIDSFRELAGTGQVEFLAETYAHSLVSLKDKEEFFSQVRQHQEKIQTLFGYKPVVFRNTELIYSDDIGALVADMGFKGVLTEGAKHVLGWKSPNYLYANPINPKLKVLLKNFKLSDDIAFRFSNHGWSEYPLTTEKFVKWLNKIPKNDETVNLFMDYETFGEHHWKETGILEFLKHLPETVFSKSKFSFSTPAQLMEDLQPVSLVNVPNPISWADEERDLTAWLGNPLQEQAFNKLYDLLGNIRSVDNRELKRDFTYLQQSDHFYYMCTKFFSDGDVHSYFNPFDTPYEAFINYMNILSDFEIRLNAELSAKSDDEAVRLSKIIAEKDQLIKKYEKQLGEERVSRSAGLHKMSGEEISNKPAAPKKPARSKVTKISGANAATAKSKTAKTKKSESVKKPVVKKENSRGKK